MGNKSLIRTPQKPGEKAEVKEEKNNRSNFLDFLKKYPVFSTILISLIILIVFYFWMSFHSRRENNRIIRSATTQIEEINRESLLLMSRPMVWSIRAEMMRGNLEQISLLLSDMVKDQSLQNIFVANIQGEIIVSTNKVQEGQQASQFVAEQLLHSENSLVEQEDNSLYILAAPVLGFDRRLGTLVIRYQARRFDL
jgi:hypothetical protein